MNARDKLEDIKAAAEIGAVRLLDTEELCIYIGCGRNKAMQFGHEACAVVQIGRRVLWDRKLIDEHIDSMVGQN